jgi:hypothetical protein
VSGGITDDNARGRAATAGNKTTDDERRKAALYVCHRARDRSDATELLLALGLLEPDFKWTTATPHGPRRKVTDAG